MNESSQSPKKPSLKDSVAKSTKSIVGGALFTKFVRKQSGFLLFLFLLSLLYITNKYGAEREMTRIEALKYQVTDLKYEVQSLNTSLVGQSRQSQVLEKLKKNGFDLEPAKTPPYELKK